MTTTCFVHRPAEEIEKQPPAKFVPHLGGCVANPRCVAWHDLVGSVLPHSFAFAVPSEAALGAIEALKRPIVEMGAGKFLLISVWDIDIRLMLCFVYRDWVLDRADASTGRGRRRVRQVPTDDNHERLRQG
jgi:hypothetical protein